MLNLFIVVMRFNRIVDEPADRRGIHKTHIHLVGNVEVFVKPATFIVEKETLRAAVIPNMVDACGIHRNQVRAPLFLSHLIVPKQTPYVIQTEHRLVGQARQTFRRHFLDAESPFVAFTPADLIQFRSLCFDSF
jgi:hypothetical protein